MSPMLGQGKGWTKWVVVAISQHYCMCGVYNVATVGEGGGGGGSLLFPDIFLTH